MEENEYHQKAEPALENLVKFAEELEDSYDVEVEYESGVITLTMPNKRQYVINKHTPSRQIWVSSPYSGAGYFEFRDNDWHAKRASAAQDENLYHFITDEINSHVD